MSATELMLDSILAGKCEMRNGMNQGKAKAMSWATSLGVVHGGIVEDVGVVENKWIGEYVKCAVSLKKLRAKPLGR